MQSIQRRRLLKVIGAFFLSHPITVAKALVSSAPTELEHKTFASFLDTLLPRDELSGSATDFHIDDKLWELSKSDPRFRRLIDLGCKWLNMTGGPPFAELTTDQKTAVVEWMSKSDWNKPPRRFYELMRQVAMEFYYSDLAAWSGLPIERPPQPRGYPPPWK